ncbi:metal-dependent hydrolase [Arthrobacter jiangjiafuii]|uniref:Metal-dependent hydrolase n=1 Tax=Arthrobacter jiangjiafuii TaxID=2817475 RepID=A0A975M4T8_9MICC|nr:metal-dependent hydrolase [Arthrobacter jiangjiafuii]MBP3042233.1 metal-dependent hydrolase [Arthrobacter jiangjiafuii]QWC09998.1 metal-dependent hydrolase [Arthrobacter jiangjiafuii]
MSLPTVDTTVTYPSGAVESTGIVLHVEELPDGTRAVLLDTTAVHPVDAGWPDQGADRAVLTAADGTAYGLLDAVVAATDGTALFLGADIPVKKGTEGWAFTVAHLLPAGASVAEGEPVRIEVDRAYRAALSAGHTACHLASLALNRQLAGAWKKDVQPDAAGNPNFDALAIETSTITEHGSTDVYRLGKSLRRKGFMPEALLQDLPAAEAGINAILADWTATGAKVRIECDGEGLTDLRRWTVDLPEGTVHIPCGGTHAQSLAETGGIQVTLTADAGDGAVTLTMDTICVQPAG